MMKPFANPQKDELSHGIWISAGLHVIVFIVLFVRAVIYPTSEPLVLDDVIKVDIVALPDKNIIKNNLPPVPAPPAPEPVKPVEAPKPAPPTAKAEPPKPEAPKVNLNKTHKTQDEALKRIEALNKIESMMKNQPTKAPAPQPIKGNQISTGAGLKGIARIEHESYLRSVDASIKSHWALPGWMANANLSARVRLFIDSSGNVVRKSITRTSHNEMYDARVLAAIEAASPLPAPPAELANVVAVDGIEIELVPD